MTTFFNRILQHPGLKRYGSNILWLLLEKAVRLVLGMGVGIYVARQLGPTQYGLLNYAISLVAIFAVVAGLGLDSILIRELVKHPEKRDSLLGSGWILKSGGIAVMMAALAAAMPFLNDAASTRHLIWLIAAGYLFQSLQVLDFYFQSKVQGKYLAISQLAALLVCSAFRVWFAWKRAPLENFAVLESAYMAFSAAGYVYFYLRTGGRFRLWRADKSAMLSLLRDSWPMLLAGGAGIIQLRIDQVMLKTMLGDAANGQYSVAVRLMEILLILALVTQDTLFPSIVGLRQVSLRRYFQRVRLFLGGMFYLALLLYPAAAVAGYYFIRLLYGPAYYEAATLYVWLCLKILFVFPGMALGKWYTVENRQLIQLYYCIIGAGMNVGLNWILIPCYGTLGAAWATLLTLGGGLFLQFFWRIGRYGLRLYFSGILLTPGYCRRRLTGSEKE